MSAHGVCSEGNPAWFDESSFPAFCWFGHPIPAVILPITICLVFVLSKYVQHQQPQIPWEPPKKYQSYDHDYLPNNHSLVAELLRIAAFVAPFCCSLLITNYSTTCIGWLPLLGLGNELPSFTGAYYLGYFSFLAAWMVMSFPALLRGDHRRAKRQPWSTLVQESIFDAEAVGWAVAGQLALWLVLRATALH